MGEPWRNALRPFVQDAVDPRTGTVLGRVFCAQKPQFAAPGSGNASPRKRKPDDHAGGSNEEGGGAKKVSPTTTYATSLDRALAWRGNLQHERGKPFLVLAHEKPRADYAETRRTIRVYEVVCADLFLHRYCNRRQLSMLGPGGAPVLQSPVACDRFACEVAAGPCKLYFDLEFHTAFNESLDGDHLQGLLLRACEQRLRDEFTPPVACTRTVVLDSSKPGKFSRHVIVTLDGGATVFADARDVARFLEKFPDDAFAVAGKGGRRVSFFDTSVYNGRQPFRLYAAGKYSEPNRLLLPREEGPWASWEFRDPDRATLQHSMVTYHGEKVLQPGETRTLRVSRFSALEAVPGKHPAAAPRGIDPPEECLFSGTKWDKAAQKTAFPEGLLRVLFAVPEIAACEPISVTHKPQSNAAFVSCKGRYCEMAGRDHASNTAYVHVDLARGTFRVRCHSPSCSGGKLLPWRPLPQTCKAMINSFLADQAGHAERKPQMGVEACEFLLS